MDPAPQTSAVLFQPQSSSKSSQRDADESSQTSTPRQLSDLEKAETVEDERNATTTGATRTISLRQRPTAFNHPLSHVKTSTDVVVDFDGPDDPYRPINWPFRKKVITTVLYGFTTMGSTWASSV